jgi:hypothetical protein
MKHDPANPPLLEPDAPLPVKGFVVTTLLIVKDVHECYKLWKSRGAHFLT